MRGSVAKPERIKLRDAATILGGTMRTVQALAARGQIPGASKLGGLWYFDPKRLAAYKDAQAAKGATQPEPIERDTVYVVRCGYHIKIGHTKKLLARLATIQTSNVHEVEVLATFDGTKAGERMLYEKFKEFRARGEWFYDRREIRSWANRHRGALP